MSIYMQLLNKPVFTVNDVNIYYDNVNSARSAIYRLVKANMVKKIRNNLYTCVIGANGEVNANRFQIACGINDTAYISHHTAMEYYGITDQVYYDVYVSSKTAFNNFEFDGYIYHYVKPTIDKGVEKIPYSGGISVTDKERTVLDSLKDMDKISGAEEVLSNIEDVGKLNEGKLIEYLAEYDNQFLYQKVGFVMTNYHGIGKSLMMRAFKEKLQEQMGNSKRYFSNEKGPSTYNKEWQLVVPDRLLELKNGGIIDADI
ncbi:Transcriptional regulator, predicted component of viral defense system [Pseudobutyrivibrio sp. OR37]|uniref:type IV toxin-antitoxin system AbiEi family antitoxin domain-containing protein n=1 Tax=Pseudobutyrivibrio sp. OR37 TaxID=1798186 RepID=UPI0008E6EE2B|nr:hypothetical protein [Pseudobutyrivibrio sp. OR37]SFI08748.1 Transcriptional regulator, predicted component of viral defense system [Pseudobutyrivibrio sp. OR37]